MKFQIRLLIRPWIFRQGQLSVFRGRMPDGTFVFVFNRTDGARDLNHPRNEAPPARNVKPTSAGPNPATVQSPYSPNPAYHLTAEATAWDQCNRASPR